MIKAKFRKFKYLFTLLSASVIIVASCKTGGESSKPKDPNEGTKPQDPNNPFDPNNPGGGGGIGSSPQSLTLPDPQVNNQFDSNGNRVVADQYPNYDAYVNLDNLSKARRFTPIDEKSTPRAGVTNPNDIDPEKLKAYDDKAKKLGLPTYRDAFGYGFLLPNIDDNGQVGTGLVQRKDLNGPNLIPAYQAGFLDSDFNFANLADPSGFLGLPRTILNDNYRKFSKTTYSFYYSNDYKDEQKRKESKNYNDAKKIDEKFQSYLGTTWILDYKLPETNETYPTTWYFASNMHVLENLLLDNIAGTENDFRDFQNRNYDVRTNFARLTFANYWNTDVTPTGSRFATSQPNSVTTLNDRIGDNFEQTNMTDEQFKKINTPYVTVNIDPAKIKPIFLGADFLKPQSTPQISGRFSNAKTMIDFGVIEVTFNSPQIAKWLTGDYANWDSSQKYTFASSSLLNNETYKTLKQNDLYAIGFPNSYDDYKVRYAGSDGENIQASRQYVSYWTNKSGNYYANLNPNAFLKANMNQGGDLSWSNTRTFVNKPGVTDILLSYPSFNGSPNVYSRMPYINTGLGYLINNYVPAGGASGTRIIDSSGKIWGILYGVARSSTSGYVVSLRSEGMNYDGLYGSYNLPQYDLIYGGGKDQNDSYLDQMKKRRGSEKTWLFPNGVNNFTIPPEFQFHKSTATK